VLFGPGVLSVDYDFFLAYQDVNWQNLHLWKGVFLVAPLHFTVFGNLLCFDMEVLVSSKRAEKPRFRKVGMSPKDPPQF